MAEHEDEDTEGRDTSVTPRALLRDALVDDADPRFPPWLPLPGVLLAVGWAGYQAVAGAGFFPTLLWPGVAIVLLVTLAAWFGWQLEID